ncbi:PDZ domain-containing protein [bacterium]|nr:PDZ domain-containing protein [bacterium]
MKKLITKKVGFVLVGLFVGVTLTGFRYDFFEIAKQIEIYNSIFKEINMGYVDKTNPAQLMENGVKHMLTELDPYTIYSTEQDVQNARIYRSGVYVGIGAKMRVIEKKLFIEEPFKGLSADKAGLKAGDEVIKINNLRLSESFEQAKLLLNGKNKSSVLITYKSFLYFSSSCLPAYESTKVVKFIRPFSFVYACCCISALIRPIVSFLPI